ncbi:MAG: hypothetical protein GY809_08195 [Planctomycetes bacterium]|nr:hypothetical protein [Planctomycetota bacterium]
MKRIDIMKALAIVYVVGALGILVFWIEFYTGISFPMEVMKEKIANFEGYYAWETAFTVPDSILACCMIFGAVRLFRNQQDAVAITLLKAASGACLFLGVLDFTYSICNGMFLLDHYYSFSLILNVVFLIPFGLISLILLHRKTVRPDTQDCI